MKLKDIIELLKELKEEDYYIEISTNPIIDEYTMADGEGIEVTTKCFSIEFTGKEKITKKFKKDIFGIKKYEGEE